MQLCRKMWIRSEIAYATLQGKNCIVGLADASLIAAVSPDVAVTKPSLMFVNCQLWRAVRKEGLETIVEETIELWMHW